jgi:Zn-dependent protease with chaperone function
LALRALEAAFHAGNLVGGSAMLCLGGFVPVGRDWLRDRVTGWPDVVRTLGGVPVSVETTDPDADFGPALARGDAPELFTEVSAVARRLNVRPPDQVRLTYLPCCGVFAHERSRAVVLGMPLLHVLNRAELRAVLAHELAHLARGDATRAARSSRFVQALDMAIDAADRPSLSPLRAWAAICRGAADRLNAPVSRGQEARADRASAAIAGGDASASALVKVAAVQPLFREVLDAYDPDEADGSNLYAFFRLFWSRLPEDLHTAIRHRLLSDGEVSPDLAHPPLLDRLASVQGYPSRPAIEADLAPASSTVGDLEALEQMLHNRLFALGRIEPSVFHRAGR